MGTKRAALYLRQSMDRDEGIGAQRKRCTALAEARGWQVVEVFEDNMTKASQPRDATTGWGQMLPRIGKDFDVIVSVDLDRLLRSTKDLNTLIDLGAQVVTVDGEIDLASADGEFRATMLAGIGRFETRRASERQKRHKAAKAERGEWHGGTPPYGYKLDPETRSLVPSEPEVERVREVARRMLENRESMHAIIVDWNDKGIRTRKGNHWRQPNLRAIMMNRAMLGETVAGVRGWEPIIEERTFNRMHALLSDPARKVTQSPGASGGKRSLGGGLTRCGLCGESMVTHSKATGKGKGTSTATLACVARVHGPNPEHHPRVCRLSDRRDPKRDETGVDTNRVSVSHDVLEEHVFETLITLLKETPRFLQRMSERDPELDAKIDALEERRTELRDQRGRAQAAYVEGIMTVRESRAKVESIERALDNIDAEARTLLSLPVATFSFDPEKGLDWRSWSAMERRAALRGFIDRIEVYPYPAGVARTRPRFKNESEQDYLDAKWDILKVATSSRTRIAWKWEKEVASLDAHPIGQRKGQEHRVRISGKVLQR